MTSHEELTAIVAYLIGHHGLTEKEVVAVLRDRVPKPPSQPTVNRLKAEARRRGWMGFAFDRFDTADLNRVRAIGDWFGGLQTRILDAGKGYGLRSVEVFHSERGGKQIDWDVRLDSFARAASSHVARLLRHTKTVGLGWGHTLAVIADELVRQAELADDADLRRIAFVPTSCEPLSGTVRERSSSSIVATLAAGGGKVPRRVPSLSGFPSVIPVGHDRKTIFNFLRDLRPYREIFGAASNTGVPPLIEQMDSILTSVGSLKQGWTVFSDDLVASKSITRAQLEHLVIGDIGGVLIEKRGLAESQQGAVEDARDAWTGIRVEHYQRIAQHAANSGPQGPPGVVVIAIGNNKAGVVEEVVRRKLVNALVIDDDLADELAKRLTRAPHGARPK